MCGVCAVTHQRWQRSLGTERENGEGRGGGQVLGVWHRKRMAICVMRAYVGVCVRVCACVRARVCALADTRAGMDVCVHFCSTAKHKLVTTEQCGNGCEGDDAACSHVCVDCDRYASEHDGTCICVCIRAHVPVCLSVCLGVLRSDRTRKGRKPHAGVTSFHVSDQTNTRGEL